MSTLETSTPISDHVHVDFELQGCPINKHQLLEVISAFLNERRPAISDSSVCMECKRRGNVCVMVAHGTPCLGPVTHAGCGALCPSYDRGCYGCYGPMQTPNTESLSGWLEHLGADDVDLVRALPHLQRERGALPRGERGGMSTEPRTRTIRTDALARVEGEGAMRVQIRDGDVEEVQLRIYEPPRFFEAFLRGRRYTEPPDITARICGICPVAYQMSACAAIEDACGVTVDRADPAAAAPPLLRRVDREPHPARLHAARAGLPRLRERRGHGRRPPRGRGDRR